MAQQIDIVANLLMKVDGAESGIKKLQNSLSGLKLPKGLDSDLKKSMSNLEGLFATYRKQIEKGFDTKGDVSAFTKTAKSVNAEYDRITRTLDKLNGTNVTFNVKSDNIKELEKTLDSVIKKREELSSNTKNTIANDLANIQKAGSRSTKVQDYSNMLGVAIDKGQWQDALQLAQSLKAQFEGLSEKTQQAFAKISNGKSATTALNDIVEACRKGGEGFDKLEKEGKEAAEQLANLQAADVEKIEQALVKMGGEWQESTNGAKALNGEMTELARSTQSMSQQLGDLQQSTQYFFSLRNMINLLKRGISDAVQTVKELDAAMTETAVVTDFSVGDMWAKLPEYTANANKLGATIQDMYESTTLYYQQGLNTQQSMAIATETMKMARIAGLEAKDATDMMTAALRGFNMELNETSAERINDVYSNLAAKTASDTEEIGKAMQRTASIAHSAGMSFEGTAAFLAQAVETTREPAENIGTAMKTIVARFQEMKKNPLEITEVDGEEVSYNKVDAALQSIGVSLKDANGQFRELDKVFLDISKKWNGLSQTQQRYIATIAAGSRQQSRFIAMMGDYDRTVELMSYANDSAGASQEQFNKTLDSLEAKINKFQNAWDQFLMGIMNDSWVKGLVDAGTTILKTVNGIIDALSFGGKAKGLKSLLSIGTAGVALKAGGNLINKLIGGVGGFIDPASSFGKGFWGAGKTISEGTPATGLAGKITTPIVAKLNELIAVTRSKNEGQIKTSSTVDQYKATNQALRKINMDMGSISALFGGLSDEHAYTAYKNAPGTADAMKQAALGWLGSKKMPADAQKTGQQLMSAIFKGMDKKEISIKDGMKLIGQPQKWGEQFGTDVAWNFSNSFSKELTSQAHGIAIEKLGWDPEKFKAGSKELADYLNSPFSGQAKQDYLKYFKEAREELLSKGALSEVTVAQNGFQQFANKVGTVGSAFSSAGMSLQMFGSQLGQLSPALQGVGNLLSRIGMAANTFGMGISGIGTIVTKLGGRVAAGQAAVKYGSAAMAKAVASGAVAAESTVAATGTGAASAFVSGFTGGMSAGPIAAIIAAVLVGGIAIAKGIIDKKAREAGKEIQENFEKGFTETNKKIDSLEGYRDRFNELSEGVDQFGHNISLTDEEFDEYLSISRELQELSPSLIAGYNAEGQAILRKGEALDEVIGKLKEERDLSLENYISNDSVDKLIKAYNTSDAYKQHHTTVKDTSSQYATVGAFNTETSNISKAIEQADLEWSDFSQILEELGIGGAESISQLTNSQLSLIADHYTDILNKIKEVNPQLEEEAEDGLKEAFAGTSNAIEDVLTEGAPIVDALRQWMGQEQIDAVGLGLGEEFVSGFNSGIEGLMLEGLTNNWKPEEYKAQLKDYANEWEHLAGPTSQYNDILKEADQLQQDYLNHIGEEGAVDNYRDSIEESAQQLENLANNTDTATEAGQIFAQQCLQQANALRNYATEGAISLGEALNILSGKFAEARGAKEKFDKATEGGDYYTAAEGLRSIAETVLDDKNVAGDGSLTAWIGAEQLLGKNFVDNAEDWDEVRAQVEKVNKLFDDGIEGVYNFNDMLVEAVNSGKDLSGLGEVVDGAFHFDFDNVDNLQQYADLLGISEDVLVGMIDKSRQFTAFNVGNNKQIRQALEQSEQAMTGQTYGKNGKSNLYMSESSFREEAYAQGIRGDDYTKTKKDLTREQNVQFLTVDSLKANKGDLGFDNVMKDLGLTGADKNLENTVSALTKMGFDVEEQKEILKGQKLADGEATAEAIEQTYQEQEFATENPTVAGIANDTGIIASAATALLASMGILTQEAKGNIATATNLENNRASIKAADQDYTTGEAYLKGTSDLRSQISANNDTIALLQQGISNVGANSEKGKELQAQIDELNAANDRLGQGLTDIDNKWAEKLKEAQQGLQDVGKTQEEQALIDNFAVDISSMMNTENLGTAMQSLTAFEDAANLSHTAMVNLAQDFVELRATDLGQLTGGEIDALLTSLGLTAEEARKLKDELQSPFRIETQLTGTDLEQYINGIDGLTSGVKTIALDAELSGEEKVEGIINEINNTFGDGDTKKKTVIIEATSKLATGDKEGANKLLIDAFGEDKAEEITKQLSVLYDGSIANASELQSSLNSQLDDVIDTATGKTKEVAVNVKANVKANYKQAKVKDQNAKVNYKRGTQAEAKDSKAGVDYNKIIHQKQPEDGKAGVSYNYISYQKPPEDKHAKVIYDGPGNARGRGFTIPAHYSLSFGSAAQGMNIPTKRRITGKQITSLVGEEGYEIGYIPSEGRSVIFGANGPEMTSFPNDTIIYPHDQSKEIIRRGKGSHKILGSFVDGLLPTRGGSGGGGGGGGKSSTPKPSQTTSSYHREITKILIKGGKVSVWWENIARMTETRERAAAKTQKKFDKLLQTFGTTATKAEKVADTYRADLQKVININKKQVNKANSELRYLDKKGKASISYQVTKKKGSKKTTETKKETVNIGKFIKQMEDGTYVIDQKAITKIAKKNKAKAEAIKQAIEQRLNDKISKRNKALDEIEKAQDKLAEISNNIYDTFYRWEFSLNKIYFLAQKLSSLTGQMDYRQSREELVSNRVLAGYGPATATDQISQLLNVLEEEKKLMIDQVEANIANAEATKEAYLNSIDFKSYVERYEKAPDAEHAAEDIKAAKWALRLIEEGGNFDESQIEKLKNQGYNEYTINQIKEILDDIDQKRKDALQASTDANASINTIYNKIVEYESYISDFEADLLTGIEEQTEKEINRLDKLNSSLSKAYKDLLDEVKRALDERRKREDNAKTERDIAQKQQRLAALRADTSGGHQVEIAQLEKEIAEAQQNYQRTLEDQLLENLQNQGDKAEKQRQQQIELLSAQKEIAQQTGTNLLQVQEWLKDPEKNKEQIRAAWLANKGYDDMTERQKTSAEHEFEEAWMKYGAYLTEVADLREVASNTKFESIDSSVKLGQIAGDVEKIANQVIDTKATGGIGWSSFKAAGGTAEQARELGALASSVQSVWGTKETFNAGYTKKALTEAGITVKDLHQVGIKAGALKKRDYKASELKDYYSIKELAEAGYSYSELRKIYKDSQIKKALNANLAKKIGVPDKTIAKWYGSKAALKAGAGGAAVQAAKGTGLQTQQKIVNESKKDKATQSSLAGISTKLDTNGKKKGGKINATVNASGKSVTGNKGSTLYTRKIDTKTGKLTGDVTTTKIADLSTADFTKNKKEATDALIYAIKHREVGSKISSKMKSLVSVAGIAGKTYKLKNNVTASVGANGKIYYATKDAVKIWNASTGKVDVDKYNKNEYLKKAQKNNSVSREYAQALINRNAFTKPQLQKKGVKKFAAGGLASYTGPAWLDGTPSKPELVLNPTDTKNFLALRDVLDKAIGSANSVTNSYGGNATYEININVDKIEKDYDVDRVAERVKKIIVKDSGYRNVTQVRNFR